MIFGLTAVWNEDDIIYATVRNLFVQGVDQVFVIDDGSDDETCNEARAAGATVVSRENEGPYSEERRTTRIREIIDEQTTRAGGDVWWLVVDADEFPRGVNGQTVREMIETLPSWVDIVGSRVLDHLPDVSTHYERRQHPARSIRLARWYKHPYCPKGHWKHPLFRMRVAGDLFPLRGRHTIGATDGRRVRESGTSLLTHHVPLRDLATTESKLMSASAPGGRYDSALEPYSKSRVEYRLSILDNLYNDRFALIQNHSPGEPPVGLVLKDWRELVPASERTLPAI